VPGPDPPDQDVGHDRADHRAAHPDSGDLVLRFTIAVVSVSGIIFFSAMVPSILATEIPISLGSLVIIWFERVILTIVIAAPLAHLLL